MTKHKRLPFIISLVFVLILGTSVYADDSVEINQINSPENITYNPFDVDSVNQALELLGLEPVDSVPSIEEVNEALQIAIDEVNEKIENGDTEIEVRVPVGENEIIVTVTEGTVPEESNTINEKNVVESEYENGNNDFTITDITITAYQKKDVDVKIVYNDILNHWTLQTTGVFMWGPNSRGQYVVDTYSGQCKSGARWPYTSEIERCSHDRLDPSWVKSYNVAVYKHLEYLQQFHGYITVSMYGTGNYTVDEAYFDL